MNARPCGLTLIALAALLTACQDNPPRPDSAAPAPPEAGTDPVTAAPPAATAEQAPAAPVVPPAAVTGDVSGGPERRPAPAPGLQPAPAARPKPAAKARLSAKSAAYDRSGPAYGQLQAPRAAMGGFPADPLGGVDWVATLRQGLIDPRADLSGRGVMRRRDDAIIMRNTLDMPWVRFPHLEHTEWLDCSNCHPHPFEERAGAAEITMDSIMRGHHCGLCHDRVAFSIFACERCHSVPHPGSPPAWW